MQWSSADTGEEACYARTPTKIYAACPEDSISGLSSRRHGTFESESLSEICGPMPDARGGVLFEECSGVKESRGSGSRSCADTKPARWHRGGQRNHTRKRPPTVRKPKSARVVSGRRHNCLCMLIDHLMCRDGRSGELILERALPLVEDFEIEEALVAYSNDCFVQGVQHHHGSQLLAAVMDRWPPFSRFGSRKLPMPHRCLKVSRHLILARTQQTMPAPVSQGIAAHLTLLNHPLVAAFILILLVTCVRQSFWH